MKLQCKLCKATIEAKGDPIKAGIVLVTHVQSKHKIQAFMAMNVLAPFAATYCYEAVLEEEKEQFVESRAALLQGFEEWAKEAIK